MSQTINFDRWIMWGDGWEVSFIAKVTLSVTRAYGSDTANVSGTAYIQSVGGSTNTKAKMRIQIGGTYQDVNIAGSNGSGGWYTYWAGDWYSQTFSFNVSVGATGGTLSGNVYFRANDINGPQADSDTKTYSQTYGTKGASTISSATNVQLNIEGTATSTVKFTSYSSSFTHKIKATLGSASTSEVTVAGGNSVNKTATLTFPASFINQITTAKTGTATVTLTTYSGSTSIGSSTKTITLTVPSGINPTVTINSVTKSAKVTNSFTEICTVLDAVTVGWSFTQSYSSPINSGSVNVDGTSGSNTSGTYTSGILTNYGARTVTVTATDKRGNSGSASQTFNVFRYFYPSLSTVKFKTNNSLDIAGNIAYVNGSNVPSLVLKIYKGESTSGTTVDLGSYIGSASGETYGESYSFNFNYPIPSSYIPDIATETYHFEVIVGDSITTATTTVYSAVAVMTFGAGGTDITAHKPVYLQKGLYGNNYQSGESFTINGSERYFGGGVLTSSGTKIEFSVPMPKSAIGLTSTATVLKLNVWKVGGGYLLANAYTTGGYDVMEDTTLTAVVVGCESYLTIEITKSTAWSDITNNTPIAVEVDALSVSFAQE